MITKSNIIKLTITLLGSFLAGFLGGMATQTSVGTWYQTLEKPVFQPPSWLFGPVWTILYILIAISAFLVWKKGWNKSLVRKGLILYAIQLILNTLWSFSFFALQSPLLGLVNIVLLLILIALVIKVFYKISHTAAYLLLPYFLWVVFATALNAAIWMLN
jgi:translocator protein